jgi:tRNA(Ile2) C34 agmatinyltransferase TiaS
MARRPTPICPECGTVAVDEGRNGKGKATGRCTRCGFEAPLGRFRAYPLGIGSDPVPILTRRPPRLSDEWPEDF